MLQILTVKKNSDTIQKEVGNAVGVVEVKFQGAILTAMDNFVNSFSLCLGFSLQLTQLMRLQDEALRV